MLGPLMLPGIQLYVLPPVALKVVEPPVQIVVLPLALMDGAGFTVIVNVVVFTQLPLAPVTVYVVVTAGVTTTDAPVRLPGIQVYVLAPDAVSVVGVPPQMVVCVAEAVTTGGGFTVTVTEAVPLQVPVTPVTV